MTHTIKTSYAPTVPAPPPIQVLIIEPNGSHTVRVINQSLATFRDLLGGYLEAVYTEHATLWCNEEGKLRNLPFNPMATYLWWKLNPAMENVDQLQGTVVVTGPADEAGDSLPIPAAVLDLYSRMDDIRIKHATEDRDQ